MAKSWIGTIHSTYDDLEDLIDFNENFGIAERCGLDSAEELWEANPIIGGSTNPEDFGIVTIEEIAKIMVSAYKEAVEFTEEYDVDFLEHEYSEEAEQKIRDDISKFLCKINSLSLVLTKIIEGIGSKFEDVFPHDLWLSRNGHGSGFFDGDYEGYEDYLQELAREMGGCDAYVGDDNLIYLS